jgi:uncharacterized protein YecT (DUF1311 family)
MIVERGFEAEVLMSKRNVHWSLVALCGNLFFLPLCMSQQSAGGVSSSAPQQALTPVQQAYRKYTERRSSLRAKGGEVFDAEMAREKAGDCKDAKTQADFDYCYGEQLAITEKNLDSFEQVIRGLQAGEPKTTEELAKQPAGPPGQELSPEQFAAEFNAVEKAWHNYRDLACKAAFHQFEGGSGAPSFEMECELKLTRDHMRELHMIYGEDLYM